jgi:NADH:quinone reductase (non-electrogenic)
MHKIVILGAGYAGVMAAVTLAARTRRREDVAVTVVNATERFTERLRLHQTASGQQTADLRVPDLLAGTGVEFVCGWVTGVDATARTVRVDDERVLAYDTLVYALGAVTDTAIVPGVEDHAYTLDGDAELLADRLTGTVAVCGSGLTGVEAAAEIAEQHPHLDVVLLGKQEPGAALGPNRTATASGYSPRWGWSGGRSGPGEPATGPRGLRGGRTSRPTPGGDRREGRRSCTFRAISIATLETFATRAR